jgi:hypothetical protein
MISFSLQLDNPFTRLPFWGRRKELATLYGRLTSDPPQCTPLIGEATFGKSALLRYLSDPDNAITPEDAELKSRFVFAYLDCASYADQGGNENYASARFWWDLYHALWKKLNTKDKCPPLEEPEWNALEEDTDFQIRLALEELLSERSGRVIFVLDNFEAVARMPIRASEWLRSLALSSCAYVIASRHLLYLLYHSTNWNSPSPLWNLFSDPIYIALMSEDEVRSFLAQAKEQAKARGSAWGQEDIDFVRRCAGRHPELLRIACAYLFEQRLYQKGSSRSEFDEEALEYSIYKASGRVCSQLWKGLADPALSGLPGSQHDSRGASQELSFYQKGLLNVAQGLPAESRVLFDLAQYGLIEQVGGEWSVFSEIMRQFVLEQARMAVRAEPNVEKLPASDGNTPVKGLPNLSYRERQVYDYLKARAGAVCAREEIKRAIWGENEEPTNSALQKIIERIREKIEPDPENPRYLLAVRGQGYMLRE